MVLLYCPSSTTFADLGGGPRAGCFHGQGHALHLPCRALPRYAAPVLSPNPSLNTWLKGVGVLDDMDCKGMFDRGKYLTWRGEEKWVDEEGTAEKKK